MVAGSAHAMHAQQFGGPFSTRPEVQVKALDDSVGVHKLLFLASPEDEEVSRCPSTFVYSYLLNG